MSNRTHAKPKRVADVMKPFEGREYIPLADLLGPLGVDRMERHRLVSQGFVTPVKQRGPHGGYQVVPEDARMMARVALTAASAGTTATLTMRVLNAGASVID